MVDQSGEDFRYELKLSGKFLERRLALELQCLATALLPPSLAVPLHVLEDHVLQRQALRHRVADAHNILPAAFPRLRLRSAVRGSSVELPNHLRHGPALQEVAWLLPVPKRATPHRDGHILAGEEDGDLQVVQHTLDGWHVSGDALFNPTGTSHADEGNVGVGCRNLEQVRHQALVALQRAGVNLNAIGVHSGVLRRAERVVPIEDD
mmetsp:Transcript_66721/g.192763  ORF Transcript_66721/g.192763 Transcript_66721/m.192763 type:complete len:207 (-) Transcript_66721:449-1069(-)